MAGRGFAEMAIGVLGPVEQATFRDHLHPDAFPASPPRGLVYSAGIYTAINNLPGAPTGINDAGQIIGTYFDATETIQSYLYSGGASTVLNVPGSTGGIVATGINDAGQIVGSFNNGTPPATWDNHGFIDSGGVYTVLTGPLATNDTFAAAINVAQATTFWPLGQEQQY